MSTVATDFKSTVTKFVITSITFEINKLESEVIAKALSNQEDNLSIYTANKQCDILEQLKKRIKEMEPFKENTKNFMEAEEYEKHD